MDTMGCQEDKPVLDKIKLEFSPDAKITKLKLSYFRHTPTRQLIGRDNNANKSETQQKEKNIKHEMD